MRARMRVGLALEIAADNGHKGPLCPMSDWLSCA
eukprot:COSAG03_NODE_7400_length_923_cov_1.399272_1_plen_33_part_10